MVVVVLTQLLSQNLFVCNVGRTELSLIITVHNISFNLSVYANYLCFDLTRFSVYLFQLHV